MKRRSADELTLNVEHRPTLIGRSDAWLDPVRRAERVAATDCPVLLLGETGTGKEVVGRHIHQTSARSAKPMVALNCAAIPRGLIESELFGHDKGAFTGADGDRAGAFEQADGGTLLLDEIGELPLEVQAKLLRATQEGEIRRLGASKVRRVDVRLICATLRELDERVRRNEFREDLYYRIAGYVIELPPLRDRGRDVVEIANALLTNKDGGGKRLARSGELFLLEYDWPGNVRQLQNALRAAAIDAEGEVITAEHLRKQVRSTASPLGEAESAVLALARRRGDIKRGDVQMTMAFDATSASRVLQRLVREGLLQRDGMSSATHYVPVPARVPGNADPRSKNARTWQR